MRNWFKIPKKIDPRIFDKPYLSEIYFTVQENIDKENVPPPKPASEIMSAPKHKYTKMLETKVKENLVLIHKLTRVHHSMPLPKDLLSGW